MMTQPLAIALLFFALTLSLPLSNGTKSFNENVDEPHQALEFTIASYCKSGLEEWNCDVCHNLTKGFEIAYITPHNKKDTFGFVGVMDSTIVVSFRGSTSLENWINNLKTAHADAKYDDCSDCRVHSGFLQSWQAVSEELLSVVASLSRNMNTKSVLVTGHSLGGSIGTLCALDLELHYSLDVSLITFGSPRVGNQEFADFFKSHISHTQRWVHDTDIVPHLPPTSFPFGLWEFHHVAREEWEHDGKDIECDDSGEDMTCADSVPVWKYSVNAHNYYLDRFMGCVSGDAPLPPHSLQEWSDDEKRIVWPRGSM